MIKTALNLGLLEQKMKSSGLKQANIADELQVSRESVSKWFTGENFPRARHLLKLANILGLSYSELVIEEIDANEPVYAFSKVHNAIHTEEDLEKIQDIGIALEKLDYYFKLSRFNQTLSSPKNDIEYLSETIKEIKNKYSIEDKVIRVKDIIKIFDDYNAFVIPVLWGNKESKANALHFRLPEKGTDWIYVNLDSFIFDFKYWLLHELAHLLTPNYQETEKAEEFANCFAAEFLYPIEDAKEMAHVIKNEKLEDAEIRKKLAEKAKYLLISPYTIYKQINKYLESVNEQTIEVQNIVKDFRDSLQKEHNITVTEHLLKTDKPNAAEYITLIEKEFSAQFIDALTEYSKKPEFTIGYIKNIFHISLQDAQNIYPVIKAREIKGIVSNN